MSVISFRVRRKNGETIRTTVVPANHSEEPHFGAMDLAVIVIFCLCLLAGLVLILV